MRRRQPSRGRKQRSSLPDTLFLKCRAPEAHRAYLAPDKLTGTLICLVCDRGRRP